MRSVFVLGAVVLLAACSQRLLTALPAGDGAGPVGGPAAGGGSGSPTTPTPTPPPTGTGAPSPSPVDDAGPSDDAGSYPSGLDAGPVSTEPDAGTTLGTSEGGLAFDAGAGAGDGATTTELLAECVSTINSVRAQNGVAPYTESSELESYAALAVASDAHDEQKHSYFYATGGGGVASTEDELDGAQVDPGGSAEQTFELGLQGDVQGQGQALANLVSTQLSEVGCGFAQDSAGNWWVDMALR